MTVSGPNRCARAAALVVLLSIAASCVSTRPYTVLSENADPLRTQFNNDLGRIRIVMLVAPT